MKFFNFLNKFKFADKLKSEVVCVGGAVIDLGCGKSSPIKFFSNELKYSLGIDKHLVSVEDSIKAKIHTEYVVSDILEACRNVADNSFDCALALDIIEHLEKRNGEALLNEMARIAKKRVIIYTPNGFLRQAAFENNEAQKHLSGWNAKEMKDLGFKVYGMSGLKILRKELGEIKYKPRLVWQFISSLTQILVYYFPGFAFQILCVKKLNKV